LKSLTIIPEGNKAHRCEHSGLLCAESLRQAQVTVEVKVRVAEQRFDRRESLEVMCDIEFPRDAHAAVDLHGLLRDQPAAAANLVLERAHGRRDAVATRRRY